MSDNDKAATKADLQELRIELVDRIQRLEREFIDLKGAMRWQIIVPSLTLIVSLVIHYIFR